MTNRGARFEILVDGKTRSYPDRREVAIEAAQFLKGGSPHVDVAVRDIRTNISTPADWKSEISATPMKVG
jgi:hypothetical protein